jgi:hypothetical protein
MASLKKVHDIYAKHVPGNVVWHMNSCQISECTCGAWLHNDPVWGWIPLIGGHFATEFINTNPVLYPKLRTYFIENQGREVYVAKSGESLVVRPWVETLIGIKKDIVDRYKERK